MKMKILHQVWRLICREKLFSAIYIFGTALTLATVTIFAVNIWNNIAPVYPEYNRANTVYIKGINITKKGYDFSMFNRISHRDVKEVFEPMEHALVVMAKYEDSRTHSAQRSDGRSVPVTTSLTNPAYFKLFNLDFIAGKQWEESDFESGRKVVALGDRTARRIFGASNPEEFVGKHVSIDFSEYLISGIFREGSAYEKDSYAGCIIPYTTNPTALQGGDFTNVQGGSGELVLSILTDDIDALREECNAYTRRFNSSQNEMELDFGTQPVDIYTMGFTGWISEFNLSDYLTRLAGFLLALLLIPAFNLSGIISGRMEGRLPEMGIRKAFGASKGALLRQVLLENLILTLAGAAVGYILAWLLLQSGITQAFIEGDFRQGFMESDAYVAAETTFAPQVIFFTVIVCCILNIMSALIPAWKSLRHPIVESLKENM